MEFESFLEKIAVAPRASDSRLYALVDHAGAPGLLRRLRERPQNQWSNLFESSTEENAIEAAPLLLDLSAINQGAWLQWLHAACSESTSLTLLHSSLDIEALAQRLKCRLEALLPDGVPAMLRYFDTRILESLVEVLTLEQRSHFFGIASCWQWLDRAGDIQIFNALEMPDDAWPMPFAFTEKQQNAMIDAAEADALVQQMQIHGLDLCAGHSRAELHAIASTCIAKANHLGLDGTPSQTIFALTTLQLGPDFTQQPEWVKLLPSVMHRNITFEDAIKCRKLDLSH